MTKPGVLIWGQPGSVGPAPRVQERLASLLERLTARKGGDGGGPAPYVTVYQAGSWPEAHIVKGLLESEDIPVLLEGNGLHSLYFGIAASVDVSVPRTLEDKARSLIEG